ncbi:MAG: nuclear transport factor 2 family protein [Thermoleophilia bacterium]|nr:nuclear transport factor 2 family protein [Thermoleophilia bacterium]
MSPLKAGLGTPTQKGNGKMPSLADFIADYGDAWNRQDLDAICALHADGMVFENHNAGERAEGEAVRDHIAAIFEYWPDLRFEERATYVGGTSSSRSGRRMRPTRAGCR